MIDNFESVEHRFLSNFYDCFVVVGGRLFASSEHAYQTCKTNDPEWQEKIRLARSPAAAKRLGRECPVRPEWEDVKVGVMRHVLACKFEERSVLALRLLATGVEELVEGNTWGDTFWGQVNGVGENWLGRLLMKRRDELRS